MRGSHIRAWTLVGQVGLTMVVSILLCLFAGLWVDKRLGTAPLTTLVFVFLGVAVGGLGVYRMVQAVLAESVDLSEDHREGSEE